MEQQKRRRLGSEEWKALARAGDPSIKDSTTLCVKSVSIGVRKQEGAEGDDAPIIMGISSAAEDRHTDTVALDGWRTENYTRNPVVLFAHDDWAPPVGKSLRIFPEGTLLLSEYQPTPRDMYEMGWMVGRMLREGFLNAASVGFLPKRYAWNEERGDWAVDYLEQELLEWSVVPVPANPECLVQAKSQGLNTLLVAEWAAKTLDTMRTGGALPAEMVQRLEKTWAVAGPQRRYFVTVPKGSNRDAVKAHLQPSLSGEVLVLEEGVTVTEVEGNEVRHLTGHAARKEESSEPAPAAPEDSSEDSTTSYAVGARVGCNRPEWEGKAGTVVEVHTGPAFAVKMDGQEEPLRWVVREELMEPPESTPVEPESTEPSAPAISNCLASEVAKLLNLKLFGRLPE